MNGEFESVFNCLVPDFHHDEGYWGLYFPVHFVGCKAQTPISEEVSK